jgi:hypothetical protein
MARERFGRPRQQFWRGAAEDEESCRGIGPIGEHPQHGKEVGPRLDLVEHHETGQASEGQLGILQPQLISRTFEVEVMAGNRLSDLAGQRGLA